jgi:negative regulator of flagellin synthesis FlgM
MVDSTGNIPKPSSFVAQTRVQQRGKDADVGENIDTNPTSATPSVDSAEITPEVRDAMKKAETTTHEALTVDEKKVADIKKAIAEGNYPIDTDRTAANMVALESLLTGTKD